MDRPFRMAASGACDLAPVPVDQNEVVGTEHLAEPDPVALEPEAALPRVAQRKMTERHVAMPFHLENAAGAGEVIEAHTQVRLGPDVGHASPPDPFITPLPAA